MVGYRRALLSAGNATAKLHQLLVRILPYSQMSQKCTKMSRPYFVFLSIREKIFARCSTAVPARRSVGCLNELG
jgi:hypothetical protein